MQADRKDLPNIFPIAASAVTVTLSLYILLNTGVAGDYAKWAFGMIAVVAGYWLENIFT